MLSISEAMKAHNTNSLVCDSVGNEFKIGDFGIVLGYSYVYNHVIAMLAQIRVYGNGVIYPFSLTDDTYCNATYYILKVDAEYINHYRDYFKSLFTNFKSLFTNNKPEDIYSNYADLSYMEECRQRSYKSQNGSLRGIQLHDYLNRRLNPGDLVVYADSSDSTRTLHYGIVVSDTQLFTEKLEKKRVFAVCRRDNLNAEETKLKTSLSQYYLNSAKKKTQDNKTVSFGDVYRTSKDVYIYLGKIDVQITPVRDSDVYFDLKVDSNADYWIKVTNFDVSCLMHNENNFNDFLRSVMGSVSFESVEYKIKSFLVVNYKRCKEFTCLSTAGPAKASYIGNLGITTRQYSWNMLYNTELSTYSCKLVIK